MLVGATVRMWSFGETSSQMRGREGKAGVGDCTVLLMMRPWTSPW